MSARPLLLAAGDLPSLVFLALRQRDRRPMPHLMHVHDGRASAAMRLRRLREQMDRYGILRLEEVKMPHLRAGTGAGGEPPHPPLADAQMLLAACQLALRRGLRPVVWTAARGHSADVQPAGDPSSDPVSARLAAAEVLLLLEDLQQAAGVEPMAVETPLIELNWKQLLRLGSRASADPELSWACVYAGPAACGVCTGCRRLRDAR